MNKKHKEKPQTAKNIKEKVVQFKEETFGFYADKEGTNHVIKGFIWKNHNKVEAQVITYGARITSLKVPNRKGIVEDIVLGFDDIAGYLFYDHLYMGATIGRTTDIIEDGTFVLNSKQQWVTKNDGKHHVNGGSKGFDKVIWKHCVSGTKLILTHVSEDKNEGYPGDLFVRITYELTSTNEFVIDMEAFTSNPTIVSLSNLLYFNLGGHGTGAPEIAKHTVNINANCFLLMEKETKLPSGNIQNVIYTCNDYQIPVTLKSIITNVDEVGADVQFCVNRGIDQGLGFVARVVHPPSGRILEVYSNQYGVHFETGNNIQPKPKETWTELECFECKCDEDENIFNLIHQIHLHVSDLMALDEKTDYSELGKLIHDLRRKLVSVEIEFDDDCTDGTAEPEYWFTPFQIAYLEGMYAATNELSENKEFKAIGSVVKRILDVAMIKSDFENPHPSEVDLLKNAIEIEHEEFDGKPSRRDSELKRKGMQKSENIIPEFYKDGRVHGKNDAIYRKHSGICLQTGNYPNAIYHPNFPRCQLCPGETYKHTIVYRFWLQGGNYHKWIKRQCD